MPKQPRLSDCAQMTVGRQCKSPPDDDDEDNVDDDKDPKTESKGK